PDQIVVERGSITVGRWGRIPVDDRERALVGWVAPRRLTVVPFLDLWTAVEERRAEALRTLVEDKIVLILTEPARGVHRTPVGSVDRRRPGGGPAARRGGRGRGRRAPVEPARLSPPSSRPRGRDRDDP